MSHPAAPPGPAARWSAERTPQALVANGTLAADACAGPARCVAVGWYTARPGTSPLAEAWNGTAWRILPAPVPAGATDGVLNGVSCASASACVAVGHYVNSSGVQAGLAEAWDGTSWTVQATPDPAGARHTNLQSVSCTTAASCVAVGFYRAPPHVEAALAERWNGTAWTLQRAAIPPGAVYSALYGVSCGAPDACTAVGRYLDSASDLWVTLAERWDGGAWAVQATPDPADAIVSTLYGVSCSSAAACMAVGDFINHNGSGSSLGATLAEAWNGSAWTVQATPNPAGLTGIAALSGVSCRSPVACRAAGYYQPGSVFGDATLAEAWNGTTWTIQPTVDPGRAVSSLAGVSCGAAAACTAVGGYHTTSGTAVTLAERWNGTAWAVQASPVPAGAVPSVLAGVSCGSPSACMAVGFYANAPGRRRTLAEAWNGSAWRVQPTPDRAHASHNLLDSVSCASATACSAVGESYQSRGSPAPLAEAWNGRTWTIRATPSPPGTGAELSGVSCASATTCTAVGYDNSSSGTAQPLAEQWNGTSWAVQPMPSPAGGYDSTLESVSCSSPRACTAVGSYVSSGEQLVLAERWNGVSWTIQATPVSEAILYGVWCSAATACIAAGESYSYPSGIGPLAEAWNGGTWTKQKTPDPAGSDFTAFYGVSCRSAKDCAAVGGYRSSLGVSAPLAEAWNGTAWNIQATAGNGDRDSVLAGVSGQAPEGFTAVGSRADRANRSLTLAEASPGGPSG